MTDFVTALEAELLAAARRRSARRPPRRWAWRPPLRLFLVAATALAAIAAAVLFVPRPASDVERPVGGPASFALPALPTPQPCAAGAEPAGAPVPDALFADIALLRRLPNGGDRLPASPQPIGTWLPVGDYAPRSERRPHNSQRLTVVPTADVRNGPVACGATESRGPGACLVVDKPIAARCFTLAEIRSGRAFALAGERLTGLVPDGSSQIDFSVRDAHALIAVNENTVQETIKGLKAGEKIAVKLDARPPDVLMHNYTRIVGLAGTMAARVRSRLRVTVVTAASDTQTARTTQVVATRKQAEPLAREVAATIGGAAVRSAPAGLPRDPDTPGVIVYLGIDRMR